MPVEVAHDRLTKDLLRWPGTESILDRQVPQEKIPPAKIGTGQVGSLCVADTLHLESGVDQSK